MEALEVDPADLIRKDLQLIHEIGEAAHKHRLWAARSASVTGVDDVVGIMPEHLAGAVLLAELVQVWRTAAELF